MITYHSIQDILELCEKEKMEFWQVIEHADMEERAVTEEASYAKMQSMYAMARSFAYITKRGRISAATF